MFPISTLENETRWFYENNTRTIRRSFISKSALHPLGPHLFLDFFKKNFFFVFVHQMLPQLSWSELKTVFLGFERLFYSCMANKNGSKYPRSKNVFNCTKCYREHLKFFILRKERSLVSDSLLLPWNKSKLLAWQKII